MEIIPSTGMLIPPSAQFQNETRQIFQPKFGAEALSRELGSAALPFPERLDIHHQLGCATA
jgi:hypothetical protein